MVSGVLVFLCCERRAEVTELQEFKNLCDKLGIKVASYYPENNVLTIIYTDFLFDKFGKFIKAEDREHSGMYQERLK